MAIHLCAAYFFFPQAPSKLVELLAVTLFSTHSQLSDALGVRMGCYFWRALKKCTYILLCLQPLMSYQSHDRCSTTYCLITCKVLVLFKIFAVMTARQQNAYYKQYNYHLGAKSLVCQR